MSRNRFFSLLILFFTLLGTTGATFAQEGSTHEATEPKYHEAVPAEAAHEEGHEAAEGEKKFDASKVIFGHIRDSHEWHFFSAGETHATLPLPVIIYNKSTGEFKAFCSSAFGHEGHRHEHEGYILTEKDKIEAVDGSQIIDFSITKNILSMLISVALMLWIMLSVAKKYKKKGTMTAPSGFQNALESVITFMRDEVAKPNLGHGYARYMPLILTVFFFIWINNLLGLLPGGANFTGNIAVTLLLSIISFLVMIFSANKHFWSHLFNPPGVPLGIKFLLVPIEFISLFIKPVALTIRLFANILAGHIVILSVISMIFIFGAISKAAGIGFVPVSLAFSIFMFFLELLVAAIQAFIFANLTAVFIGQAIEEPHHNHSNGQEYDVSEDEIIA